MTSHDVRPTASPSAPAEPIEAVADREREFDERTALGNRLRYRVLGQGRQTVLFLGAIHGNEPTSHRLLERFVAEIRQRPALIEGVRVVVASPVNPDGLSRGLRHNTRGTDLNRNFPARNWTKGRFNGGSRPLSEPESRFVHWLIEEYRPAAIVSVHAPLHCVNYDGPARSLAEAMARANGYPVKSDIGYPTPGSLGSFAGIDRHLPIVTLELPPGEHADGCYGENRDSLLAAVRFARTAAP